jgi:hypothetical protein
MVKLFWQYRGRPREYPTDEQGMFNDEVILSIDEQTWTFYIPCSSVGHSIINNLLLDRLRYLPPFILLVAQLRFKARIFYRLLNGSISETVWRSCGAHHIFFDHDRTEIIGTRMQTDRRGLFTHREP